jgi:hypothetical protein
MNELTAKFDRLECTACVAYQQCGARRLVDDLIRHMIETQIDQAHGRLIDSTNGVKLAITDSNLDFFKENLAAYNSEAISAFAAAHRRSQSVNGLIEGGLNARATMSDEYSFDDELVRIRDVFIDREADTSLYAPDVQTIRAAVDDILGYQDINACRQV